MKILHVTPHLGGGVGKAHAAISAVLPEVVEQTFVLLEAPRDRRFIDKIEATGARVTLAESLDHVASLAREADIVQFEFWNHPRMFECLARTEFPPIRSVFWSHISGLFQAADSARADGGSFALRLHDGGFTVRTLGCRVSRESCRENKGDQ